MIKPDGGPAFPIKGYCTDASGALCGEVMLHQGMSLRDYFAAEAMKFCLSGHIDVRAQQAYEMADAMLKEREK